MLQAARPETHTPSVAPSTHPCTDRAPLQQALRGGYALADHYIVRADFGFAPPFSVYDINTGDKYTANAIAFIILRMLEQTCLTADDLRAFLSTKGYSLGAPDLAQFLCTLHAQGIVRRPPGTCSPSLSRPSPLDIIAAVPVTTTPYEAEIHLTNACNLRCRHCAYDAGCRIPGELKPDAWLRIFDELESYRVCRIALSGGEVLLYRDIKRILAHLATKKIRLDVLTNGTLIDEATAEYLACRHFATSVSLDGATPKTHELLRGRGSHARVMRGLAFLARAGAAFNIITTLHKKNVEDMEEIVRTAVGSGARYVGFIAIDAIGRAAREKSLLLTLEDVDRSAAVVQDLIQAYARQIRIEFLDPSAPEYRDFSVRDLDGHKLYCPAGTMRLAIRSDGVVVPCVYAFRDDKFAVGRADVSSIGELWCSDGWGPFRKGVDLDRLTECSHCALVGSCTLKVCRLRAYYLSGDFFGTPPSCRKNR